MSDVDTSVMPPVDCPPGYPSHWPWPPPVYQSADIGQSAAWTYKLDVADAEFSDRLHRRDAAQYRRQANLDDERHDTQADFTNRDRARAADFANRDRMREQRFANAQDQRMEDTRQMQTQLLSDNRQFNNALWASFLNRHDASHALSLQIVSDAVQAAQVARAYTWNLQFVKALEKAMGKDALDAALAMMKEMMGPPRGGVTPMPSWGYPPGQPTPQTGA